MLDFLLEQDARPPFFIGAAIVSYAVVAAFFAHQKGGAKGVLTIFLVSWLTLFLLYVSVYGVGHFYNPTLDVRKALAIVVALSIPLIFPTTYLAFGRRVVTRDWADLVLAWSLGIAGVFVLPGVYLILGCMFTGDCL